MDMATFSRWSGLRVFIPSWRQDVAVLTSSSRTFFDKASQKSLEVLNPACLAACLIFADTTNIFHLFYVVFHFTKF